MLAYACEPDTGGEPSVGWFWAENAARHGHEVVVLTRENNRAAVESGLAQMPPDAAARLRFVYHDLGRTMRILKKRAGVFSLLGYYYLWQLAAVGKIRACLKADSFDLLHHVTFCNDSVFSVLGLFKRPFLLGPTGGYTHAIPPFLLGQMHESARRYERRRRALQFVLRSLDPLSRLSRARATKILTYSEEAMAAYGSRLRRKTRAIRHVGVRASEVAADATLETVTRPRDLNVVTAGRLVHWKGFDLAIEAVGRAIEEGAPMHLTVIGSGPEERRLRELADIHAPGSVSFAGRLPAHEDVMRMIRDADVFIQPTLRDGPPVAILEAMSVGTLVVTADFGANAELVPGDCGLVVANSGDRARLVDKLGRALERVVGDPSLTRIRVGNCLDHVRRHRTWEAIGLQQQLVYEELAQELGA